MQILTFWTVLEFRTSDFQSTTLPPPPPNAKLTFFGQILSPGLQILSVKYHFMLYSLEESVSIAISLWHLVVGFCWAFCCRIVVLWSFCCDVWLQSLTLHLFFSVLLNKVSKCTDFNGIFNSSICGISYLKNQFEQV